MLVVVLAATLLSAAPPQNDAEARLRAGRSALSARDYQTAKREFSAVLAADASNPAAHLNLGIIALIEGNPSVGLVHFSAVPGDVRSWIGRLDCELRLGKLQEARSTARQLDAMTSSSPAASEHVGKLLANAGEYAASAPFLRRATGAAGANLLGTVEEKSGNLDAAARAFADAARLEPANEDYRIDHAAVLLTAGHVEASVAAFRSAAEAFPRSARVRVGLGSALYVAGRHEPAAQALLEAVRLDPGPRAFDLLGKAYEASGPLQPQIRVEFEKYLRSSPADAAAYAHYGAMVYSSGEPELARTALARSLQLQPGLAAAHLQLGIMEQATGNWKLAAKYLQRAAELQPDNSSVRYRLATVYGKLGYGEKARAEILEFRRLKASENALSARP